jgi:hypothetical protein
MFAFGGLGAPGRGQILQGQRAGKGGAVAAVVKGAVLVSAVVQAWAQGHIPEQAFGGHGRKFEDHAEAAGHGQHNIRGVRLRIAGGRSADGSFAFQGGLGCGGQEEEHGQAEQNPDARTQIRHRG